ncbi:MAG: carboxymuconolactone decarboxylase family protein [Solirubrobacterales bacterium]|nr:carboxymuconolactone decarboxylase family protein [Solirubrobacterales bacterium]
MDRSEAAGGDALTRVRPIDPERAGAELREAMERQRDQLGLVPESLLTMALRPGIATAWAKLAGEVTGPGTVDRGLKQLVAYVASATHGCRYCQAHTGQRATSLGVDPAKLRHAFEYETSELFDDAERDALRLARDAALVPNEATDEHFERLRRHFSDEQIVELVAVIAMFGWLNRWNDTMATTLELDPLEWAQHEIASAGWEVGQHAERER